MKRIVMALCIILLNQISAFSQNTKEINTIHEAAALGNARSILAFLQEGISVNAKDSNGRTPLMAASESGMSRVISLLLERGAEVNAVDNEGNTALHIATEKGQIRVINDLIVGGASMTIKNFKGFTAKELASQSGNTRILNAFPSEAAVDDRRVETEFDASPIAPTGSEKLKKVLEDPNEIRARLSADPKLISDLEVLFKTLEDEETKWTSRRQRIKNTFFNALRKEIDSEIVFIQNVAKQEDANDIFHELDVMQSTWKNIFAQSSRKMREAVRNTSGLGMQDMSRATRSRTRRVQTADPTNSRRGTRGRDSEAVEEVDPHESYINSWSTIEDNNLDQIYQSTQEKILSDMGGIRLSAERANETRILNAIDGVMLERKLRGERSLVVYNLNKEELSEATNATSVDDESARSRRGRTDTTQTQQTGRRRRR